MKTLLVMRHAKSSWQDESLDDHERPLNQRGRQAAPRMGALLLQHRLLPDQILCSTAARARQTWLLATQGWPRPVEARFLDELYHCPAERILPILRKLPRDAQRVLLIGHNPGLAEFLETTADFRGKFPTGALAQLTTDASAWSLVNSQTRFKLHQLWRPRDLD